MKNRPPSITSRVFAAALAGAMGAILLVAWRLEPRAVGYGTAKDLNWPGCSILTETGWPCPMCGMTTSTSATLHGQWALAWRAHPFGPIFTAGVVLTFVLSLLYVVRPALVSRWMRTIRLGRWWIVSGLALLLLGWGLLIWMGTLNGTWPVR